MALVAVCVSTLLALVSRAVSDPNAWLGLHGTFGFACVVVAGLLAGRRAGLIVGGCAAILFLVLVAYAQPPDPLLGGLPVIVFWAAAGYLVGAGADQLRGRVMESYDAVSAERDHHRRIATTLQAALIPPRLPPAEHLRFDSFFRPAGDGTELGGDFYDAWRVPGTESFGFVLGDICGKGAEAAALASLARHTVRTASVIGLGPAESLQALNDALRRRTDTDRFVTACTGLATPNGDALEVSFVSAGHPLPILRRADGSTSEVGAFGTLLGVFSDPLLVTSRVRLQPGDVLVVYSDGVTDVRRGREIFGLERLLGHLANQRDTQAIAEGLHQALSDFSTGLRPDDIAVLTLEPIAATGSASAEQSRPATSTAEPSTQASASTVEFGNAGA